MDLNGLGIFWVNYNDLTVTHCEVIGMMVTVVRVIALFQVSELLQFIQT